MIRRAAFVLPVALALLGASSVSQLDSQYVLQRYALELTDAAAPKVVVFSYTISQAGLGNIEEKHVLYRSGTDVRDETISVDGVPVHAERVRIDQREDRYTLARIAPRADGYQMLFVRTVKDGSHDDYVYEATPLVKQGGSWVDRLTIDGVKFLPRTVHFQTQSGDSHGSGTIEYAPFGKYWMPVVASVEAVVNGKPARERITWSDYRFPPSLPPSTFNAPKPLPTATLPPI